MRLPAPGVKAPLTFLAKESPPGFAMLMCWLGGQLRSAALMMPSEAAFPVRVRKGSIWSQTPQCSLCYPQARPMPARGNGSALSKGCKAESKAFRLAYKALHDAAAPEDWPDLRTLHIPLHTHTDTHVILLEKAGSFPPPCYTLKLTKCQPSCQARSEAAAFCPEGWSNTDIHSFV